MNDFWKGLWEGYVIVAVVVFTASIVILLGVLLLDILNMLRDKRRERRIKKELSELRYTEETRKYLDDLFDQGE